MPSTSAAHPKNYFHRPRKLSHKFLKPPNHEIKIKAIIKALAAEFPLILRYLQVDYSSNTGYASVEVRNSINPQVLEYSIVGQAKDAGLRCTVDHKPGSIHYRLDFEKA